MEYEYKVALLLLFGIAVLLIDLIFEFKSTDKDSKNSIQKIEVLNSKQNKDKKK